MVLYKYHLLWIWLSFGLFFVTTFTGCDSDDGSPISKPLATFAATGFLIGDVRSEANAVSWDGSVVVGTGSSSNDGTINGNKAFIWTFDESIVELGFLQGGTFSEAHGVSSDGSVVLGQGSDSSGAWTVFTWEEGTGFTSLDNLRGSPLCVAGGISGDGAIVVGTCLTAGNEAFRWTEITGSVSLGQYGPGSLANSAARAISSDGRIIVGVGGLNEAIMWSSAGIIALPTPVGAASAAHAVSGDGSVVVGYTDDQAFRWTQQSGVVVINKFLSGISTSTATGVSGDGKRIVGWGTTANGNAAFLWDEEHGMRLLETAMSADYEVEFSGWKLTRAMAISGDGSTIVGYGTNPDGQTEGWVLVLPD